MALFIEALAFPFCHFCNQSLYDLFVRPTSNSAVHMSCISGAESSLYVSISIFVHTVVNCEDLTAA